MTSKSLIGLKMNWSQKQERQKTDYKFKGSGVKEAGCTAPPSQAKKSTAKGKLCSRQT